MSYQEVTGTVSQGAHPGSYNGQDAYNDMLITEKRNELCDASIRRVHNDGECVISENERLQGCYGSDFEGGVENEMSKVRRLTPNECAALQGFPRDWCDIGEWVDESGKKHKDSDSAKMRAIGNSIALPFWHWLLKRISAQYEREATLGSLFDGIGGFPFCWESINGKGSAVWASEIEPFCIAVTKKHFPEESCSEPQHSDADEPILLESNQNHATIRTDGISTALPAAMGNGGGYVPMITECTSESINKAAKVVRTIQ